ncbi:MAG: 50S ribosomal protein L5, partial [Rhodospirillales bacterium]|nr:50S ribosomal protein L5 [Rhodospirillales bacterium]
MAARFRELYDTRYREELQRELGITNRFAVPRLEKIVLNMGVGVPSQSSIRGGLAKEDDKGVEGALRDLEAIAGQRPVATEARKPIAGFKIRQGMKIGCKVTLRSTRMYEFLDRLINIALPRVR